MRSQTHQVNKLECLSNLIHIDGSRLGGVIRNASAYAYILGIPVQMQNLRLHKPSPGLKQQHVCGLQLLARICGGLLEGVHRGSRELLIQPGQNMCSEREFIVDQIKGSTMLVFQSALPVFLFAKHEMRLVLKGKTDDRNAMGIDYAKYILIPFLQRHFGIECNLEVHKRGLSFTSDGEILITVHPLRRKLNCISLRERGEISSVIAIIWNAKQDYKGVLEQQIACGLSKANIKIQPTFVCHPPTPSEIHGLGILLYGVTYNGHRIAATSMLEIPPQADDRTLLDQIRTVGDEVVRKFAKQLKHGGVVDEYLADQLVIFMALASSGVGPSEFMGVDGVAVETKETSRSEILVGEVSLHTQSAMRVAEVMLRNIIFSTEIIEGVGKVIICERKRDN